MKQIVAFVLVGGFVFAVAATMSFGLYWLAPIVPCDVIETSGYGRSHEDLCTGEQVQSYSYGAVRYSERRAARHLHVVLALGSLGAGGFAGLLAMSLVQRAQRRKSGGAASVTPARRAA